MVQSIIFRSPHYYFFKFDDRLCDLFHEAVVDMVSQVPHDASDTLGVDDYGWPDSHRRLLDSMIHQLAPDLNFYTAIGVYLFSIRPTTIPISMRIAKDKQMAVPTGLVGMGTLLSRTPARVALPLSDDPLNYCVVVWQPGQALFFTKFAPRPLDGRLSLLWATFVRRDMLGTDMSLVAESPQQRWERMRAKMQRDAERQPIKREPGQPINSEVIQPLKREVSPPIKREVIEL